MTKKRAGFRNVFVQIPDAVWAPVEAEMEATGASAAAIVSRILQQHYRLPSSAIPPRKKAGRKPKAQ